MRQPITLLILLLSLHVHAQFWSAPVEVPDYRGSGGGGGEYNSMAVVNGKPCIVSADQVHKRILWVRALDAQGTTWAEPQALFNSALAGTRFSLAVVNGFPAFTYLSNIGLNLMYVRALDPDGLTWGEPVVVYDAALSVAQFSSLAVVNGKPAIAFRDESMNRVRYVRANDANGADWGAPVTCGVAGTGYYADLKVVNGSPAICHTNAGAPFFVRANDVNGDTWGTTSLVVSNADNVNAASLEVIGGVPCVAIATTPSGQTPYVRFVRANDADGTSWSSAVLVDAIFGVSLGWYAELREVDGLPAIAYMDVTNLDLRYARATNVNGSAWNPPQVITSSLQYGQHIAFEVVDGHPAVAQYEMSGNDLVYVRALNAQGSGTWDTPITMDSYPSVGLNVSQAIVEGYPALAYWNTTDSTLRYIRAQDSTGTTWSSFVDVDPGVLGADACVLFVANGRPMIAYRRVGSFGFGDVMCVRANDALGATWGTPVLVENSLSDFRAICAAVIDGWPALAYRASTSVRYKRALDADGSTWPVNPFQLNGGNQNGLALLDVGGMPMLVFNNLSGLSITTAMDAAGTSWSLLQHPDGLANGQISSTIVSGMPALSYYRLAAADLMYIRATAANGTTWGSPVTVQSNGTVGLYSSLAVVDGAPAIAYSESAVGGAKYVRANNATGSSWGTPVRLDTSDYVGSYINMLQNGTHTGVSYFVNTTKYPNFVSGAQCTTAPPAPVDNTPPANLSVCAGSSTALSVVGEGSIRWYNAPTGGTLLGSGSSFNTPVLFADQTYYAQDSTCLVSAARTPVAVQVVNIDVALLTNGNTITVGEAGAQYQWLDCNAAFAIIPNADQQSYIGNSGSYAVEVIVGTCMDTSACELILTTGIAEHEGPGISIAPNPMHDHASIFLKGIELPVDVTIMDAAGRMVGRTERWMVEPVILTVDHLAPGTYQVLIELGDGSRWTRSVIRMR
ncbi:MAG: T9SS type A sorting domain-containing protein [Flavobacteriales bacterium]|nr:MAG: T9SS type A sorting domain-containing protein [Flavobacteriales bacterium]